MRTLYIEKIVNLTVRDDTNGLDREGINIFVDGCILILH